MVSKEEFNEYVRELVKDDEKIKTLAQKYLIKAVLLFVVSLVCVGICVFGLTTIYNSISLIGLVVGLACFVVSIVMMNVRNNNKKQYRENHREKIIHYLLRGYEHYFQKESWPFSWEFENSQFVKKFDLCSSSDYLEINIPEDDGKASKVDFKICDLYAYNMNMDEEGNVSTWRVYEGLFGYAEFPRKFNCILSIDVDFKRKGVKLEKVELEDVVFNRKFKVKSNNQIEARYILSPDLMDKIFRLESKFNNLKILFVGNYLYIGAPDYNLFELQELEKGNPGSMFENLYEEINVILSIVNEIKANNKIFKTSSKKRIKKINS